MNIVSMVLAFLKMPGAINPAILSFIWGQETDKRTTAEKVKIAVAEYARGISKDDQDGWMRFLIQTIELDELLHIGLVTLGKDKIREVYADMLEGWGDMNWVADWIAKLAEIELRNQKSE